MATSTLIIIFMIFLPIFATSFVVGPLLTSSLKILGERMVPYNRHCYYHCLSTGKLVLHQRYKKMPLRIDLFGLGPSEIVIIIGAGLLLYGPDRVKQQLRDSGVKGKIVSAGWKAERLERICDMEDYAEKVRKSRSRRREIESLQEEIDICTLL